MAQHTITLPCIADTWIDFENVNTGHGSDTLLQGGNGNSNADDYSNILLKFDWSSLPVFKNVISVNARVYNTEARSGYLGSRLLYNVLQESWTESTTWDSAGSSAKTKGGTVAYDDVTIPSGYLTLNLTSIYNNDAAHLKDNGIRLRFEAYDSGGLVLGARIIIRSRESSNPPYVEVVYEDILPGIPNPINPIGDYVNRQDVTRFEWEYVTSIGDTQAKFDLQWSTNQTSWTTIAQTTANTYYDMPAGTLPTGNIYWRVRTYNGYGDVSGYSAISAFYVIGAPANPTIQSISTGTASPTVTWTSSGQQAYELRVRQGDNVIHSTGTVPSTETSHKITAFLSDGSYIAGVRIKNAYDLWSGWGEQSFSIATPKPGTLSAKTYGRPYGVRLVFASPSNYALVYRREEAEEDYIRIGKVNAGQTEFDDYSVASGKTYVYFMRNVSMQGTYADGATAKQSVRLLLTQLAPAADPSRVYMLKYNLGSPPQKTATWGTQQAELRFEGRAYPVYERNGFRSETLSCTFWVREYSDVMAFYDLFSEGEIVLLRDSRGRKIYGVLGDIQAAEAHPGYALNFTVTRCDFVEEVEV
jgi:hypothetical protein